VKLTDEELEDEIRNLLDNRHRPLAYDNSDGLAVLTELRQLRALLNTPMAAKWSPRPSIEDGNEIDGKKIVWLGDDAMYPDEAIALGASLIRAALAAKGQGDAE